jgi:hypothetical protein
MLRAQVPSAKTQARRIAAALMTLAAFGTLYMAERPVVAHLDNAARDYAFSRHTLPELPGPVIQQFHNTHPELHHLTGLLSTSGAAAALSDLDGDGLPNDVCYVDTRTDQVIVAPVPGTGERYRPFALEFEIGGVKLFDRDRMVPMGCLPGDLNEDGHIDLLVYFAGRTPILLLSQAMRGNHSELGPKNFVPSDIIPGGQVWTSGSATLADLDGDGHLELIVVNYFADGVAIFDAKSTSALSNPMPDSLSRAFNGGGVRIYRCVPDEKEVRQDVKCTEVIDALPKDLPKGWGLAVGAYDIDGDLLPEIYVANDYGPDRLLWNRSVPGRIRFELVEGKRTLDKPRSLVVGQDAFASMGVDFADLNGDGIPDIMVTNITSPWLARQAQMVFLSVGPVTKKLANGIAPYIEAGDALGLATSGWAWDCKFDDFNNDGILEVVQAVGFLKGTTNRWPEFAELAVGNDALTSQPAFWPSIMPGDDISGHERNPFFVRVGERYIDIAAHIGFGEDNPSRGIAIADVDGDGKLDMVVANMWALPTYYHNECTPCGNFLGLHLRLATDKVVPSNTVVRPGHPDQELQGRPAIGAAVTVTTATGRVLTRQVDGGNGHSGKRSPDLHFGLAKETDSVQVDIKWRDNFGNLRQERHQLSPGWHTVLLGSYARAADKQ